MRIPAGLLVLAVVVCGCGGQSRASGPPGEPFSGVPFAQGGPDQIAFDASGNLYVADCADSRVYRLDRKGQAFLVAGTGVQGFSGNGGPAVHAKFACPFGVAVDKSGVLYVSDHSSDRIRKIDHDGVVHPFAGAGPIPLPGSNEGSFAGDGGTRQHVRFHDPVGLNWDAAGNLYVSDRDNGAVRRIFPGAVKTVAGNGKRGYAGDGGPATKAQLDQPETVAFDAAGRMYVADSANNRVRRVDGHGVITTYAGVGKIGYTGDGGPARAAALSDPFGLAFDAAGNLYVAEPDEGVIRKIDRRGIITTAAGTGKLGLSGDGGPATAARLNQPFGIAFDAQGNLFIADHDNGRVRLVDTKGVITTFFDGRRP